MLPRQVDWGMTKTAGFLPFTKQEGTVIWFANEMAFAVARVEDLEWLLQQQCVRSWPGRADNMQGQVRNLLIPLRACPMLQAGRGSG